MPNSQTFERRHNEFQGAQSPVVGFNASFQVTPDIIEMLGQCQQLSEGFPQVADACALSAIFSASNHKPLPQRAITVPGGQDHLIDPFKSCGSRSRAAL
jgi:hypothetical protein